MLAIIVTIAVLLLQIPKYAGLHSSAILLQQQDPGDRGRENKKSQREGKYPSSLHLISPPCYWHH